MLQQIKTLGGVHIEFEQQVLLYSDAITPLLDKLNSHRGALFASSFEYPGRYTCWDIGFYNPPLAMTCAADEIYFEALNSRGATILAMLMPLITSLKHTRLLKTTEHEVHLQIIKIELIFSEEERSHQPSVFMVLRALLNFFKAEDEPYLGLYGAFGYDLIFQFETIELNKQRDIEQRDMVLYLPDEIFVVNHRKEEAFVRRYNFQYQGKTTQGLARDGVSVNYSQADVTAAYSDYAPGEYAKLVKEAKERFRCGDLFEAVLSQTFHLPCKENPSVIFDRMRKVNPSPYGFFINLGHGEYLVGASPEMYVRVHGLRVETCPISGTIKRGVDAIEDARNIQVLLESEKEASELTMCTDVDRNDKSRICEAGSVRVIGRRQIEMYSRLIHTVDHVEGMLRDGFDAIDAFLTHMWVVTVTGAPKLWAMNFIEQQEKTPRQWYAGAVGWFHFNGDLNTGLVLRTFSIKNGVAALRVGATLLYDSIPEAEEQETELKAAAFLDILRNTTQSQVTPTKEVALPGLHKHVLLIDHQDSFVHTLANYLRQTGAEVTTVRHTHALTYLNKAKFDLVLLSPGPGRPNHFELSKTIEAVIALSIPLFGVCLGLQGIVEYFGGELGVLNYPMHGKPSLINVLTRTGLFKGFDASFTAGRYHSLYAIKAKLPADLEVTAQTDDGLVMAVSHRYLPISAVQFHPETILSLSEEAGLRIMFNLMRMVAE
jgi:anthranilate synthase